MSHPLGLDGGTTNYGDRDFARYLRRYSSVSKEALFFSSREVCLLAPLLSRLSNL
jgi:hypothetical protein